MAETRSCFRFLAPNVRSVRQLTWAFFMYWAHQWLCECERACLYELPDDDDDDDDSLGIITLDVQYESLSAILCCYSRVCFSFLCPMPRYLPRHPFIEYLPPFWVTKLYTHIKQHPKLRTPGSEGSCNCTSH